MQRKLSFCAGCVHLYGYPTLSHLNNIVMKIGTTFLMEEVSEKYVQTQIGCRQILVSTVYIYSRTSMARTPLGP